MFILLQCDLQNFEKNAIFNFVFHRLAQGPVDVMVNIGDLKRDGKYN